MVRINIYELILKERIMVLEKENKVLEKTLKEIKEIAEEYISTCDFSWKCKECFYGCWAKEIMKICEAENDKAD